MGVLRGGGWNNNNDDNLRAANRNNNAPTERNNNIGARCALSPEHSLVRSQKLQTRILVFTETRSVFEGVQISHPGFDRRYMRR